MSNKRIKKKNLKKQQQFFNKLFDEVKDEDILRVENGVVQLDFNNPKHIETYERWIEE